MQKKKINILCYIKFKHGYIEKQKLKNWKYLPCMQQEKKNQQNVIYIEKQKKEICRQFKKKECIWLTEIPNNTNYSNHEMPFKLL